MNNLIPASKYCEFVFDGTHDTPKPAAQGKLLVTSKHIAGGMLDTSSAYRISESDYESINKRSKVSRWDILFSMIGSVGEVYLEKNSEISYAIKNIGVFSCKDEFRAKWLYYYLKSPSAKCHMNRYLNGAVQKFLPLSALRDFPVIPFNDKKTKLVMVLDALDAKIDCNNRINAELEAMVKTLHDYWFVQFNFPDDNGKPYKSSGGKMVYNETLKHEIPEGWRVDIINDVIDVKDGTHDSPKPTSEGYHLITSKNLKIEGLDFDNANLISKEDYESINKRSRVDSGDIIFSMIGSVGAIYKVEEETINFAIKNVALYKTSQKEEYKNYIYMYLKSYYMQRYMANVISGSIQKFISLGALRNMPILIDDATIKTFVKKTECIFRKLTLIKLENKKLAEVRDWLIPMLMSSQVTVKAV